MDLRADFLIIGSGIAALRAAPEVAGHGDVLILTKAEPDEGNTGHAQGGIAAAVGRGDTPELHARDTMAAGAGLCDERAVQVLVEDGPRFVRELGSVVPRSTQILRPFPQAFDAVVIIKRASASTPTPTRERRAKS